ncbi:hypothetical protein [Saccharothrix syringae]|nr:hypothetical protein [Saccharothrix syringae]
MSDEVDGLSTAIVGRPSTVAATAAGERATSLSFRADFAFLS